MKKTPLMKLTYFDPDAKVHLTNYADMAVYDKANTANAQNTLCAIRFGGYPESVNAMVQAINGGCTVTLEIGEKLLLIQSITKRYRKQLSFGGIYAETTLIINNNDESGQNRYLFCGSNDRDAIFEAIDKITAVPLIPEYREFILTELERWKHLRPVNVISPSQPFEAWALNCGSDDKNIVEILESGLASGEISIPGAVQDISPLDSLSSVTEYLNTFGVSIAERIKKLFVPLFDPENEPLSPEILKINETIMEKAGYSLYDAQLAVAEAIKRQLSRSKCGLIVAECGSGKTKIGMAAMAASVTAIQKSREQSCIGKSFNIVLCPSHVAKKWVREIKETLPNTEAAVVRSITELDRFYESYEYGDKDCYAIISKEKARDGYMRTPAVSYSALYKGFVCPACGETVQMTISDDGTQYLVNADQFFFKKENSKNHKCKDCGSPLWTALNPDAQGKSEWIKIGEYGFVHRRMAGQHLTKIKNAGIEQKIMNIANDPDGHFPAIGAYRSYPLSTYIKKKYKGRVYGVIVDELHQYAQNSGQGDAMAELYQAARKVIGMTATLINGYSSGIFYLLYRMAAPLMKLDGKEYASPAAFNEEYGVIQNVYTETEADYNSNRRAAKVKKMTRQLPGVSPLVYSRFLLDRAAFLSLTDMGKDLPSYEEIPIALTMPENVRIEYENLEKELKDVLKQDKKAAQKILSAYLNLLTAYPDQPYGHEPVIHPITCEAIVMPPDISCEGELMPKDGEKRRLLHCLTLPCRAEESLR